MLQTGIQAVIQQLIAFQCTRVYSVEPVQKLANDAYEKLDSMRRLYWRNQASRLCKSNMLVGAEDHLAAVLFANELHAICQSELGEETAKKLGKYPPSFL